MYLVLHCSAVSQSLIQNSVQSRLGSSLAQWLKSLGIAEMRDKSKTKERKQCQIHIPIQSNPVQQKHYSQNQTHRPSKAETHAIQTLNIS